jgi:hypothetical protein
MDVEIEVERHSKLRIIILPSRVGQHIHVRTPSDEAIHIDSYEIF